MFGGFERCFLGRAALTLPSSMALTKEQTLNSLRAIARRGLTLSARRHASASKSFGPGAFDCIFFEPRRRGDAIFSKVVCFSEVGKLRPFRDAPKSSLCSTASMRLQLMLQQPAKRIVLRASASIYRYISLLTGAETSLVATVFATASSSRSQVSLRGIVGIVPIEVRPLTRPDELETCEDAAPRR